MTNRLIDYFLKITDLTVDEIGALTESMSIKRFPKGSFLIQEGQSGVDTYFILEGCVRQCRMVDGNDITINFFTEEQWIISLEGFDAKTTSNYSLVCVEEATLVIGNEHKAQALFKQFPRLETTSRQIMETVFAEQHNLLTSYITDTPEQRYVRLMKARPDILQRVPQYDIATFIGVKPESLSRIRKRLLTKR